jgi:maleylacetoacetate isomerase
MILYDYYRSTACYRVRIALHYKGLAFNTHQVHLVNHGGEQHHPDYLAINPQGLVPALEVDSQIFTQSLAILEYLEETHPERPLLPKDHAARAIVRSLALLVTCDIHPLNNLRVLQHIKQAFQASEQQTEAWYHHWLQAGFDALEARLQQLPRSRDVCLGSDITVADVCLIPQVYNAKRFNFALDHYPLIQRIYEHCMKIDAFVKAQP